MSGCGDGTEVAHSLPFLREIVIFLIAAGVLVPLLRQLGLSPVLGYLILGALIGPHGLGAWTSEVPALELITLTDPAGTQSFAELGVVFLLFVIGLELSWRRLWAMRVQVLGLGSAQILVSALIIAMGLLVVGVTLTNAVLLGAALALSSTAIVIELLKERNALSSPLGRSCFAILLMQDLAIVPMLFTLGVLAAPGQDLAIGIGIALLKAATVIAAVLIGGRWLLRPLFRRVAHARSPELFTAITMLAAIGTSALTHAAGLSMALGAFLAGLVLSETEYRHQIEVDIEPIKGLLLGLFFLAVGMAIDLSLLWAEPLGILAGVIALYAGKALIAAGLIYALERDSARAIEGGLLLGQGGEFAFVVLTLAGGMGLVDGAVAERVILVVSLSMAATPLVATCARKIAARIESRCSARASEASLGTLAELSDHVLIAGFGRVGQLAARIFESEGVQYVALDRNLIAVELERERGRPVIYADAARIEVLKLLHLQQARALLVTMDSIESAEHIVQAVHQVAPNLPIYARAHDFAHEQRLRAKGARVVVQETLETSLHLAAQVVAGEGLRAQSLDVVAARIRGLLAH